MDEEEERGVRGKREVGKEGDIKDKEERGRRKRREG